MTPRKNADELFRDPRRRRIHERLKLIGAGPAAFYRDACRILDAEAGLSPQVVREPSERAGDMQDPPLRLVAAAHLVGHLFREIESAIRDVLLPTDADIDKNQGHKSEINAILRAYGLDKDETLVERWHQLTGESGLYKQAHRNNLERPRALNDSSRRYFDDVEAVFDVVLARFEESFHEMLNVVDMLLAKHPPTGDDLETLRRNVPNNLVTLHHFFSQATDPAWLDLLDSKGAFGNPPIPMPDDEDDTTVLQPWPASQYLARMAAVPELQERVAEIALNVPTTQSVRVHEDLADVAIALSVPLALRFVGRAKTWCGDPWFSRVADKIGPLIRRFLGAGEVDAALQLAGALFDPEDRLATGLPSGHEAWEYEQRLRELAPSLVEAGGFRALEILTSCLAKLLRGEKGTAFWRPAIEPDDQNQSLGRDARQALINAVRDGAEAICTADPNQVTAIVQHLEAAGLPIFERIALHLLRVAPTVPLDLVESHLLDRDRLNDSNSWHEYTLLAWSRLGDLPRDKQSLIVRWAVEDEVRLATEVGPGDEREDEEPEARARHARAFEFEALSRFRGVLPDEFRTRYEELELEFGKAEHPEFLSYLGEVSVGPTSPKTADEMRSLSVGELVAYLKDWTP